MLINRDNAWIPAWLTVRSTNISMRCPVCETTLSVKSSDKSDHVFVLVEKIKLCNDGPRYGELTSFGSALITFHPERIFGLNERSQPRRKKGRVIMSNEQPSARNHQTETSLVERAISSATSSARQGAFRNSGLAITVLVAFAVTACDQAPDESEEAPLGTVQFDASCSTEVSDDFDRAIALLHHMQYEESRAAFAEITTADPQCGMAHWGIAVTLFQPLWPARPGAAALRRGWDEVGQARELGTGTDRELDLVTAAEAFFREPESTEWWTRIRRWSDAMAQAYAARPEDTETAAFYALSQLAIGQVEPDQMAYHARAAEVLLNIYDREPTHPGAIHYTIHANDVDTRARESLDIVRSYGVIAPDVPHALHMPTHIFVRLGEWPESITWNLRSAAAALRHPAGDTTSHHYPHALDYLVYAHLQRGEDEQALAIVEEILAREEPFQGTFISAFHLAAMPARYAIERRAWDEARAITARMPASLAWDQFWWAESLSWFARGLGAVHTGDADEAQNAERHMIALGAAARAAGEDTFADYIDVDRLVLTAWRAYVAGQSERALNLASEAVRLEATTQKHPVTPGALYPSQEALGDMLEDLGRPHEALTAYEDALAAWPGRFNSLMGAARAARAAGMDDRARDHYRALLEISSGGDSMRPVLSEARQVLSE